MNRARRTPMASSTEEDRANLVADATHSIRMEGLDVTPAGAADADDFIAGRISLEELANRTRVRYGITDPDPTAP